MLQDAEGTINASGNATKTYKKDEIVECDKPWQETLAKIFVDEGFAEEIKITKPTETKKAKTPSIYDYEVPISSQYGGGYL